MIYWNIFHLFVTETKVINYLQPCLTSNNDRNSRNSNKISHCAVHCRCYSPDSVNLQTQRILQYHDWEMLLSNQTNSLFRHSNMIDEGCGDVKTREEERMTSFTNFCCFDFEINNSSARLPGRFSVKRPARAHLWISRYLFRMESSRNCMCRHTGHPGSTRLRSVLPVFGSVGLGLLF